MIVTENRIAANQRNAARSTGPRTAAGKDRSKANALKHGLCSSVLVSETVELFNQRAKDLFCALNPQNHFENWLVDKMAITSLRVDRVERIERRARDRKALMAELCWEDDQNLQAIRLGSMLAINPPDVVQQLRRTPQGCEWLMSLWAMLIYTAEKGTPWTPDQSKLAFDLLGTPAEFRDKQQPGTAVDFDGKAQTTADDQVALGRREVADLKARREVVNELDEVAQALAMADVDINLESDPEMKKMRRYEATLHNRFRWYMNQFHHKQNVRRPPSLNFKPDWAEEPVTENAPIPQAPELPVPPPEPVAEVVPEPEIEPEPEVEAEPEADVEAPIILDSRVEQKLRKAEARRVADKRKAERRRA